MKKIILVGMLSILSSLSYAQTCPTPSQVFIKKGDRYEVNIPTGWQATYRKKNKIDSQNIAFIKAEWGNDMFKIFDSDKHVRCLYGNPDYSDGHGIMIETAAIVEEEQVDKHRGWSKRFYFDYSCTSSNVGACQFG